MYITYLANGNVNPFLSGLIADISQAKFLLVKLLQVFGVDEVIVGDIKAVARQVGVSDRLIRECIPVLIEQGCLIDVPTQSDVKRLGGRKTFLSDYQISKSGLKFIEVGDSESSEKFHHQLIDNLLLKDTSRTFSQRRHPIKLATRLLLAVLLSRADKCGVVRKLGMTDLTRLTGLSKSRLRTHIKKLLELGYLRSVVSGGTGRHILGKVHAVYFVNIQHERFKDHVELSYIFMLSFGNLAIDNALYESQQLFDWARKYEESDISEDDANQKIMVRPNRDGVLGPYINCGLQSGLVRQFFTGNEFVGIEACVQLKLEEYASYMLTHFWIELLRHLGFDERKIREKIRSEMLTLQCERKSSAEECSNNDQIELFVELIFAVSLSMAQSIISILSPYTAVSYSRLCFQILPANTKSLGFAVVAVPKIKNEDIPYCEVIKFHNHERNWSMDRYINISELSLAEIYQFGLKTKVFIRESLLIKKIKASHAE